MYFRGLLDHEISGRHLRMDLPLRSLAYDLSGELSQRPGVGVTRCGRDVAMHFASLLWHPSPCPPAAA